MRVRCPIRSRIHVISEYLAYIIFDRRAHCCDEFCFDDDDATYLDLTEIFSEIDTVLTRHLPILSPKDDLNRDLLG